ncbi:hypothetical protein TNIN_238161, partial [Trichonephila inaurata madagascariensis]
MGTQLEEFDYEIEHGEPVETDTHVDVSSRYPVMIICNDTLTSKLKKAQDDSIQTLKSLLEKQDVPLEDTQ